MKKRETKNDILDAATKMFAEKGYDGASIDDIAKESNLAKASLYYYYSGKYEILLGVVDRSQKKINGVLNNLFSQKTYTSKEFLKVIIDTLFFIIEEEIDVIKIVLSEGLKRNSDKKLMFNYFSISLNKITEYYKVPTSKIPLLMAQDMVIISFVELRNNIASELGLDLVEMTEKFKHQYYVTLIDILEL